MMQTNNFSVSFQRNGEMQNISVEIDPSTDDADTYVCYLDGNRITQIRKDSNVWKQLWGELDDSEVKELGDHIDEALTK